MLGPSLPIREDGSPTDDDLIARAFEYLRICYGQKMDFNRFAGANWERARLVLQIEAPAKGRSPQVIVEALIPFADAQSSPEHLSRLRREDAARHIEGKYPHMARMVKKGMI